MCAAATSALATAESLSREVDSEECYSLLNEILQFKIKGYQNHLQEAVLNGSNLRMG